MPGVGLDDKEVVLDSVRTVEAQARILAAVVVRVCMPVERPRNWVPWRNPW